MDLQFTHSKVYKIFCAGRVLAKNKSERIIELYISNLQIRVLLRVLFESGNYEISARNLGQKDRNQSNNNSFNSYRDLNEVSPPRLSREEAKPKWDETRETGTQRSLWIALSNKSVDCKHPYRSFRILVRIVHRCIRCKYVHPHVTALQTFPSFSPRRGCILRSGTSSF